MYLPYLIFLLKAWIGIYFNCFKKLKAIQHVNTICKMLEKWLTRWKDPIIFIKYSSDKIQMAYLWHPGPNMLGHYFIPQMAVIGKHFHLGTYSLHLNLKNSLKRNNWENYSSNKLEGAFLKSNITKTSLVTQFLANNFSFFPHKCKIGAFINYWHCQSISSHQIGEEINIFLLLL